MLNEIYKTLKAHQGEELDDFDAKFGEKFGIKFGINEKRLLLMILSDPTSTVVEMAANIGISQRGVEKQLKKLKELGVINRVGPKKGGHWEVRK